MLTIVSKIASSNQKLTCDTSMREPDRMPTSRKEWSISSVGIEWEFNPPIYSFYFSHL